MFFKNLSNKNYIRNKCRQDFPRNFKLVKRRQPNWVSMYEMSLAERIIRFPSIKMDWEVKVNELK